MKRDEELIHVKRELLSGVDRYFSKNREWRSTGSARIPLSIPSYGQEEVSEVLEVLLDGAVTMGERVRRFETAFAEYVGVKHAIMVNSGSSANLVALSVLAHPGLAARIHPGDEVIVPAIPWSTTVFPILQIGAIPVFVDVNLETYNLDLNAVKDAITPQTKAIMVVHLLGNPIDMDAVLPLAKAHNLFVVEDACEAHGALVRGRKVGSFGDLSTFSFFFSHHMSTIEGGMVLTEHQELADLARSLRAHGWIRDMTERDRIAAKFPEFDPRYLFVSAGYNLRPTEIQGAFGIHQLAKLESFIDLRRANAHHWNQHLRQYADCLLVPSEVKGNRHVWFGYPVHVRANAPFSRARLVQFLEEHQIETRPIMAGNLVDQPVMRLYKHRQVGTLPHAHSVADNVFLFGNHHGIDVEEREYVMKCFDDFFSYIHRSAR